MRASKRAGCAPSKAVISSARCRVRATSSRPLTNVSCACASNSKPRTSPSGCVMRRCSRSTVNSLRGGERLPHRGDVLRRQLHGRQPAVDRVGPEDIAERRRDHDAKAEVLEGPRGMLARRTATEVAPCDQNRRVAILGDVQEKAGVAHPVVEEELPVARALDPLQELLRDDLVGVHVGAVEHRDLARDAPQFVHASSRASAKCPATAAAAAMAGLTRCVREPAP